VAGQAEHGQRRLAEHERGDVVRLRQESIARGHAGSDERLDAAEELLVLQLLVGEAHERLERRLVAKRVRSHDLEHLGVVAENQEDAGVGALIITDIDRDGTVMGFNVEAFGAIADAVAIPVIAAGGLATIDDIVKIKARKGVPIAGAVLGRALYNGAINPKEALKVAA